MYSCVLRLTEQNNRGNSVSETIQRPRFFLFLYNTKQLRDHYKQWLRSLLKVGVDFTHPMMSVNTLEVADTLQDVILYITSAILYRRAGTNDSACS